MASFQMTTPASRLRFLATGAASAGAASFVRFPGEAAEFTYKLAHAAPLNNPANTEAVKTFDIIRQKTNGQLDIAVFGNGQLGSDASTLSQLRAGAIQFMFSAGGLLSSVVPVAGIEFVGFAFRDNEQLLRTNDGPLGAYIRQQVEAAGIGIQPHEWSLGPRAITTSPHPIAGADDFRGLKLRVSPAKISFELFTTLGATPVQIEAAEVYTALQTHLIDGEDLAIVVMVNAKIYEVQKYLSLSNHLAGGYWLISNPAAIAALPAPTRKILNDALEEGALRERKTTGDQVKSSLDTLRERGMTVTTVNMDQIRSRLKSYYAHWKSEFGEPAWSLLERSVGKLA